MLLQVTGVESQSIYRKGTLTKDDVEDIKANEYGMINTDKRERLCYKQAIEEDNC